MGAPDSPLLDLTLSNGYVRDRRQRRRVNGNDLPRQQRRQGESFDERVRKIVGVDQRRPKMRKGRSEVPDGISHFDPLRGSIGAKEVFVEIEAEGEPLAELHERIEPEAAVDIVNLPWRDFIQQDK